MPTTPKISQAAFHIGQIVRHKHYGFRGIIVDIDFAFSLDEQWYENACKELARMGLPAITKEQPFYHLLTDNSGHESYVSQQNLKLADNDRPLKHQGLTRWFSVNSAGAYTPKISIH